jgi:hypothetical protein
MAHTAVMVPVRFSLLAIVTVFLFTALALECAGQAGAQSPAQSPDKGAGQSSTQGPGSASTQASPSSVSEMLQRQVGMDDDLPGAKNPSGLHFRFSRINDVVLQSGHFTRYRAYVAGAREDLVYSLALLTIGADAQIVANQVYVNAKGLLMTHKPRPDQENSDSVDSADEYDLSVQVAKGEPVRFLLVASDQSLIVPGTIVPYPIESMDRKCRLELRLGMQDGEAVLIYADGLPPKSEVPFEETSGGTMRPGKLTTNAKGHGAAVDLPFVEGQEAGILLIKLATKGCSVSAEIPWGKGTYHPE